MMRARDRFHARHDQMMRRLGSRRLRLRFGTKTDSIKNACVRVLEEGFRTGGIAREVRRRVGTSGGDVMVRSIGKAMSKKPDSIH